MLFILGELLTAAVKHFMSVMGSIIKALRLCFSSWVIKAILKEGRAQGEQGYQGTGYHLFYYSIFYSQWTGKQLKFKHISAYNSVTPQNTIKMSPWSIIAYYDMHLLCCCQVLSCLLWWSMEREPGSSAHVVTRGLQLWTPLSRCPPAVHGIHFQTSVAPFKDQASTKLSLIGQK